MNGPLGVALAALVLTVVLQRGGAVEEADEVCSWLVEHASSTRVDVPPSQLYAVVVRALDAVRDAGDVAP